MSRGRPTHILLACCLGGGIARSPAASAPAGFPAVRNPAAEAAWQAVLRGVPPEAPPPAVSRADRPVNVARSVAQAPQTARADQQRRSSDAARDF